jgi:tape measure domain-containing protein
MAGSAGGLFIQVKLQTTEAEKALKRLGREFAKTVDAEKILGQSSRVLLQQLKAIEGGYKNIGTASAAAARMSEAGAKVEIARIQAAAKVRVAELNIIREQTKAQAKLNEAQAREGMTVGRENRAAARRAQAEAARAAAQAERELKKQEDAGAKGAARKAEAQRVKDLRNLEKALNDVIKAQQKLNNVQQPSATKLFGAGGSELLVGLGAARSGNYFYGLAALARYFKNVSAAAAQYGKTAQQTATAQRVLGESVKRYLVAGGDVNKLTTEQVAAYKNLANGAKSAAGGLSGLVGGAAGAAPAIAAIGAAAVVVVAVLAALAVGIGLVYVGFKKLIVPGVTVAKSFELLRTQLIGLVGDTKLAAKEYSFLLALGQKSLVPTEQLIAADRSLIAFGVTAQDVRTNLVKFISDFGTATGATQVQIDNLAFALGQVSSTGKVTAQDLRQFGNAGVNVGFVVEQIGKNTKKTGEQVREGLTAGTISANEFYKALIQVSNQRFAPAATNAALTLIGIFSNLKDIFKTFIGETFRQLGVLDPLKSFLLFITGWVSRNKTLFVPIAAAAKEFFSALVGGSNGEGKSQFEGLANAIGFLFRVVIPIAIKVATYNVIIFRTIVVGLLPVISAVIGSIISVLQVFAQAFGSTAENGATSAQRLNQAAVAFFGGIAAAIGVVTVAFITFASVVINVVRAITQALSGNLSGAFGSLQSAVGAVGQGFIATANIVAGYVDAVKKAGKVTIPKQQKFGDPIATGTGTAGSSAGQKAADDAKKAADSANKIAQAKNDIYELLRKLFGQPSEALKGLYGEKGKFEATVDSIVATAQRLTEAILKAAPGAKGKGIAAIIRKQTLELIRLAKERDKVTARLEKAQKKLDDLVAARADFANSIKSGALDYANSFATGTETINSFTRLDAVGSFITVEKQQQKSFVQSLRDRVAEYKKFTDDIKALQAKGLDPALIRRLIEAGPEAAGAAANELANANDATIAEVNNLQGTLNDTAGTFANEQADIYYKSGIDNAKAQVDGLKSQLSRIDAAARDAAQTIIDAVKPYSKKAKDAGASIGAGAADGVTEGLGSGATIGGSWAKDITSSFGEALDFSKLTGGITETLEGLKPDFSNAGGQIWDGFIDGIKEKLKTFSWLQLLLPLWIQPFLLFFQIQSPSKLFFGYGEDIIQGLIDGMASLITGIPGKLQAGLTTILNFFKTYFVTPLSNAAASAWNAIVTRFPVVGTITAGISAKVSGIKTWLTNNLWTSIKTSASNTWASLTSGFPSSAKFKSAFKGLANGFISVVAFLIRQWNKLSFRIPPIEFDWNGSLPGGKVSFGGKTVGVSPIAPPTYLAAGGLVTAPTLAMVGEKPGVSEAVIPLNKAGLSQAFGDFMGGGDQVVNVYLDGELVRGVARVEIQNARTERAAGLRQGRR